MFAASQACRAAGDSDSKPRAAAVIWAALAPDCVPDAPDALDALDALEAPGCVPGWLNCGYCGTGAPILASSAIATASCAGAGPGESRSDGPETNQVMKSCCAPCFQSAARAMAGVAQNESSPNPSCFAE
jgi:hypothetical protein